MELLKTRLAPQMTLIKKYYKEYEQFLPASFFALGFIFDILTLGEVDEWSNIITLGIYLFFLFSIITMDYIQIDWSNRDNKIQQLFAKFKIDIFHFSSGALLSAFTLFYFKSSSLSNSFLFLFIMISLLVLNEIELFQKQGIILRTSIAMLCLTSYLIYVIPIALGKTGPHIFYACILLAFIFSTISFILLTKKNNNKNLNLKQLFIPHITIILLFSILYGFKIFPPIPLSIKYIGIFHDFKKENGNYITSQETPKWKFWHNGDQDFLANKGDKIHVFTKIFAPGGFSGKVYIHWLKETTSGLKTSDRIPLKITGGRSEGFRGHAYKANYTPGNWQIKIETSNGLEIGRINFTVSKLPNPNAPPQKRKFITRSW